MASPCFHTVPPDLKVCPWSLAVVEGDGAEFTCVFEGQVTTIMWLHNDMEIEPDDNYRLRVTEDSSGDMLRTTLTIHKATLGDIGSYTCSATLIDCDPVTGTAELQVKRESRKLQPCLPYFFFLRSSMILNLCITHNALVTYIPEPSIALQQEVSYLEILTMLLCNFMKPPIVFLMVI